MRPLGDESQPPERAWPREDHVTLRTGSSDRARRKIILRSAAAVAANSNPRAQQSPTFDSADRSQPQQNRVQIRAARSINRAGILRQRRPTRILNIPRTTSALDSACSSHRTPRESEDRAHDADIRRDALPRDPPFRAPLRSSTICSASQNNALSCEVVWRLIATVQPIMNDGSRRRGSKADCSAERNANDRRWREFSVRQRSGDLQSLINLR